MKVKVFPVLIKTTKTGDTTHKKVQCAAWWGDDDDDDDDTSYFSTATAALG